MRKSFEDLVLPRIRDYLEEIAAFPNGSHDDQVDATSQALAQIARMLPVRRATAGKARIPSVLT